MPVVIEEKEKKANKNHTCSYCLGTIEKGTIYEYTKLKGDYSDGIYEWKSHPDCDFIANQLWELAEPDDGMTDDDFRNACREFCRKVICKSCDYWDEDDEDCTEDKSFCLEKINDTLRKNSFETEITRSGYRDIILIPREVEK